MEVLIDLYSKPTAKQIGQLLWYDIYLSGMNFKNYNYKRDFHLLQSKIYDFKNYIKQNLDISLADRIIHCKSLQNFNTFDVNDNDVRNIAFVVSDNGKKAPDYITDTELNETVNEYVALQTKFYEKFESDIEIAGKCVIWDLDRPDNIKIIPQLEKGETFEVYVDREFKRNGVDIGRYYTPEGQNHGENELGIEVKHDVMSLKTGNYYIELSERHNTNHNYVNSGLMKDDNTEYFCIGVPEKYYIVSKEILMNEYNSMDKNNKYWQNDKKFVSKWDSNAFIIKEARLKEIAITDNIEDFCIAYKNKEYNQEIYIDNKKDIKQHKHIKL